MNDARIKAMLKWSRKQLMQRKNKLLPKHADERFWGTAESQGDDRAGQCALDHEKTFRHHADVCCGAVHSRDRLDAERWRWLVSNVTLGFDQAPSWNAVVRIPVYDSEDATLEALIDRARNGSGSK